MNRLHEAEVQARKCCPLLMLCHFTCVMWANSCEWVTMQIFEYNGAAIVAMAGKDCIAIGSDLRFGVQFQTLATDYKKVYKIHDKLYIGLAGLGTDAQTM